MPYLLTGIGDLALAAFFLTGFFAASARFRS
jgi:hypothetical protein